MDNLKGTNRFTINFRAVEMDSSNEPGRSQVTVGQLSHEFLKCIYLTVYV